MKSPIETMEEIAKDSTEQLWLNYCDQEETICELKAELAALKINGPMMQRGNNADGTPWMGAMLDVLGDYRRAADTEAQEADRLRAELERIKGQQPVEFQIKILDNRWTHCAKHLYHPANPSTRAPYLAAGAQPYDQQALELCDKCGWKAVIPGEPCLVCERNAKLLEAAPVQAFCASKPPESEQQDALVGKGGAQEPCIMCGSTNGYVTHTCNECGQRVDSVDVRGTQAKPLTDDEIEALAVKHEAFGFGLVDAKGYTTHGFDPEGLHAFVNELLGIKERNQ